MSTADITLTLPGQAPALPEPSEREREEISAAKVRTLARRPRLTTRMNRRGDRVAQIGPNHTDAVGWTQRALDAFGTTSADVVCREFDRLGSTLGVDAHPDPATINAALAVLDGQKPKDEIEAQLLIQMAATHALAMDFLGRTKRSKTVESVDSCGRIANRLLARYAQQCDTLTSLRRGGKHVVEVRHEHVYRSRRKPEGTPAKNRGWFKPKTPSPAAAELVDA